MTWWNLLIPAATAILGGFVTWWQQRISAGDEWKRREKELAAEREHTEAEAQRQRDHERKMAQAEHDAAQASAKAEHERQAKRARRAEVLQAHEEATAALRQLLTHEEGALVAFQRDAGDGWDDWPLYAREAELETQAAKAVAKVRLLCDELAAEHAMYALKGVRRMRDLASWGFDVDRMAEWVQQLDHLMMQSVHHDVRQYEQRAAEELLKL